MHQAAANTQAKLLQALLQSDALNTADELNATDELGNMPLHLIVEAGGPHAADCAQLLLEAKANPNAVGSAKIGNSRTCLHYAVSMSGHGAEGKEQVAIAKLLLTHKANPSAVDKAGLTPMHLAARKGSTPIVQQLLEANCDIGLKDARGKTAHSYAVSNRRVEVVKLLEDAALAAIQ